MMVRKGEKKPLKKWVQACHIVSFILRGFLTKKISSNEKKDLGEKKLRGDGEDIEELKYSKKWSKVKSTVK